MEEQSIELGRTATGNDKPEPPEAAAHAVLAGNQVREQARQWAREEVHHSEDGSQVGSLGDPEAKVVLKEGCESIVQSKLHSNA